MHHFVGVLQNDLQLELWSFHLVCDLESHHGVGCSVAKNHRLIRSIARVIRCMSAFQDPSLLFGMIRIVVAFKT